jgi:hypothetical protein
MPVWRDGSSSAHQARTRRPAASYVTLYLRFEQQVVVDILGEPRCGSGSRGDRGTDSDGTVWFSARVMVESEEAIVELRK